MEKLEFRVACAEHAEQVRAFNQRMVAGGTVGKRYRLSLDRPFKTVSQLENSPITLEKVFCFEGGEIRGGASIKRMKFRVNGVSEEVATWIAPVSEGVINPAFTLVALRMEREMRRRYPLIYSSGALESPAGQLMHHAGWFTLPIPFHFSVLRAHGFLRHLTHLRRKALLKWVMDLAAWSGVGALALLVFTLVQRSLGRAPSMKNLTIERMADWGDWATDLWETAAGAYSLIGDRSRDALASLYPVGDERFLRFLISSRRTGKPLGWTVVTVSRLKNHNYFGNMLLGAMVDMFAAPEHALEVVYGALTAVRKAKADMVIVNHSDQRWNAAFRQAGMLPSATNHHLFLVPKLKAQFQNLDEDAKRFYFTRGDGHGPQNLW